MKKFITLLSAALVAVASLATVASAAPIAEDTFKPTAALDIVDLDEGAAVIALSFEVEEDLGLTNVGSKYVPKYTGYAFTAWQMDIDFNEEILDIDNAILYAPVAGTYNGDFTLALGSEDKIVDMGIAVIPVQAAYADKTAEELNELDFAEITNVVCEITQWEAASAAKNFTTQTKYRTDGAGDYVPGSRVGVEADEPVTPPAPEYDFGTAGNEFEGKASKYWTVNYEAGEFTGTDVIELSDGETTKSINVTTAEGFSIGGAVSFYVYVIGNDIADVYIVE